MHISQIKPSAEMYSHLQDTIDIVQLWDQNVLTSSAHHACVSEACTI